MTAPQASGVGGPMPAYVVVQITIHDPAAYERYKELAPPSIGAYGGRYLVRGGQTTPLEGSWQPGRFVILEFPSAERANAWWSSPEYAPAKALRQACADTEMLLVQGPEFDPGDTAASRG
jgi:uncharacterized protein (DUF1330 family)